MKKYNARWMDEMGRCREVNMRWNYAENGVNGEEVFMMDELTSPELFHFLSSVKLPDSLVSQYFLVSLADERWGNMKRASHIFISWLRNSLVIHRVLCCLSYRPSCIAEGCWCSDREKDRQVNHSPFARALHKIFACCRPYFRIYSIKFAWIYENSSISRLIKLDTYLLFN